ncbi:PREDICTED: vacuolar protein sorting-associated protein 72 homolog [Rhagoletis zephyria]|uniref:vacuolar protein sorting-associated protein 72 homolog n=1 Tax=Rhagoletis zephyria TaxID=28612 RepID=UPI0008113C46|nr:PREDICTED: vacuolar protein sorting-associated protein 72 homolog [Rhagoletis zephyria]
MAAARSRRTNAGTKIAKLLNEEEEDEFYKTSYGGFHDEEEDQEYVQKEEEEDVVDSDFSIDENDEPISDTEDAPEKKRKRGGVNTKAYKEPAVKKDVSTLPKRKASKIVRRPRPKFTIIDSGRKSIRASTAIKTQATKIRLKEMDDARKKKRRVKRVEEYMPTQEELLEEAKITEEENIKSLEKFQKMELEKKKTRPTKRIYTGPMIRYHSMTMPVARKQTRGSNTNADATDSSAKCERTFITFENDLNDKVFQSVFKPKPLNSNSGYLCPITRLPARYFDPVTKQPYYSMQVFKILREAYYLQLEERGNTENPDVAKWLEWRKIVKENRAKASATKASSSS